MDNRRQKALLQKREVYKEIYRLFHAPVKQPRSSQEIMAIETVTITQVTISQLVVDGILVKESRNSYKLAISRKKIWQRAENL